MLNQEGIRKLKFAMRANPESYDQSVFGEIWPCGTVQCMAGFCYVERYGVNAFHRALESVDMWGLINTGMEQLGIENPPCIINPNIFCGPNCWPNDLSTKYLLAKNAYERVEVACEALDRLNQDGSIMSLQEYNFVKELNKITELVKSL